MAIKRLVQILKKIGSLLGPFWAILRENENVLPSGCPWAENRYFLIFSSSHRNIKIS